MSVLVAGSQLNKFEQVSISSTRYHLNGGQGWGVLLSRGGRGLGRSPSPLSGGAGLGLGGLYSEVQCIMSNGHMGPPSLKKYILNKIHQL